MQIKTFIAALILVISIPLAVFAQTGTADKTSAVSVTPSEASIGDPIVITAAVKNTTTQKVTVTVLFTAGKVVLNKKTVVVSSKSTAKVTADWTVPTVMTDVQVEVVSAVGANNVYISSMTGVLGTVTITPPVQPLLEGVTLPDVTKYPIVARVQSWISTTFATVEPFRIRQAAHFSAMADTVRARIGIAVSEQVGDAVQQKVSKALAPDNTKAPAKTAEPEADKTAKKQGVDNPLDYGVLVGAMAMAAFFGNMIGFYVGILLLGLFIIRMAIGLISKRE